MENKNSPVARLDDEQSIELQFSFPKSISNFLPASPSIPKYQRISPGDVDTQCDGAQSPDNSNEGDLSQLSSIGLGIGNVTGRGTPSAQKVPAGSKPIEGTPTSNDFLLSPTSTQIGSGDSPEYDKKFDHRRNISGASSIDQRSTEGSEIEHLTSRHDGRLGKGPDLSFPCKSRRHIHRKRGACLSISVLVLALYSTVFSAIWLVVACVKPRYGAKISSSGGLSPSTASTITAAFAKTIELSYVAVFVTVLGQFITRRAISKSSSGVSIADLLLRSWVVQPGTLITHWESVRYSGSTILGGIALFATISSTIYTTASDALVSPTLKMGSVENRLLYGQVSTSWGNPYYVQNTCRTPIPTPKDPLNAAASTCIEIEYAGQAFSNWITYLSNWADVVAAGNGSSDLASRPPPVASLYDNTTVTGSWINLDYNMTETSIRFNRTVNNVSMAMPHAGVFTAARDPLNNIMQPQDLSGFGEYFLGASVPSPVVNVLCAAVTTKDLSPLVYDWWPNATTSPFNASTWPNGYGIPANYLNSTPVDDLFGFGEKYGRKPPVFGKFPLPYNTILNVTAGGYPDALYMLAGSAVPDNYMLCSFSASLATNCSTTYHGSLSGGSLSSHCNDPQNELAYIKSYGNATNGVRNRDWVNTATDWAQAINLNGGSLDSNAADARLLTQLIPTTNTLDPELPSIAEGLAVLAGVTSLLGTLDSQFVHFFNYSAYENILNNPEIEAFKGTLQYQDYSSGGSHAFQYIFYVVLILVLLMNVLCLGLLVASRGLLTDISELGNLFALSLNSPPSEVLAGTCGGGPEGQEYKAKWGIAQDSGHFWIESKGAPIKKPRGPKSEEEIYQE